MAIAFQRKHSHVGVYYRLWLIALGVLAFMLAVLWTKPTH